MTMSTILTIGIMFYILLYIVTWKGDDIRNAVRVFINNKCSSFKEKRARKKKWKAAIKY